MKNLTRLSLLLVAVLVLLFNSLSPARAEDETPPTDTGVQADTYILERVVDLYPGLPSSTSSYMTAYAGKLYFSANANNGLGRELWYYDPTVSINSSNPTIIDICPTGGSSFPSGLVVYAGGLYFSAEGCDGAGLELWKFTEANGAQRVLDLYPGSTGAYPISLAVYGTLLFFAAETNNGLGNELWKYDSTLPASISNPSVIDICPGINPSTPRHMTVYNRVLYLSADGCDGAGTELWQFTEANGAQRVADISSDSGSYPMDPAVYSGSLYFSAYGGADTGRELWMYNDLDGPQLAADVNSESSSSPSYLAVYNGVLYFSADGGDYAGRELWRYDPVNGADRLLDLYPGVVGSFPTHLAIFNNALYLSADSGDGMGQELVKFDNTAMARFTPARSLEGWVLEFGENTSMGGTLNNNAPVFNLGDDAQDRQYRSILSFNTASLPDNAVILSATLRIRKQGMTGQNPFTTHGDILIDIIKGTFGTSALQITDFQAAPGKAGAGKIKNLPDLNNWYTGKLVRSTFPFINKTGITQLRLRFNLDDNNDNGADFLMFHSADTAGYADFPVLEVKYYIP